MFAQYLILTAILIGILDGAPLETSSPPRFVVRTGRSRLKYNTNQSPKSYDWKLVSHLMNRFDGPSLQIPLPVIIRHLVDHWIPVQSQNFEPRSRIVCGQDGRERCFFGLFGGGNEREYNSGPAFVTPPPLRPATYPGIGIYNSYGGGYGDDYGYGGYYDDDYYEVCDEFYDPIYDEYVEDCNVISDH